MTGITVLAVTDPAGREAAFRIRTTVFCDEQGVSPEAELDAHDATAIHLLALAHGRPVGAMRWRVVPTGKAKIERVAVLREARQLGIGRALMLEALRQVAAAGLTEAVLHAQTAASAFYARLGFVAEGEPFDEEGIEHIRMRLAPVVVPPLSPAG
jgi:predicted GNAT family N-acyltransferase